MPVRRGALAAIALGLASPALAGGAPVVLRVDGDAAPGGDGATWATAYADLQDALDAAPDGALVEVRVAGGTYYPDRRGGIATGDRRETFALRDRLAILGGYAGFGAPDPDARDPILHEAVLSGDIGIPGDDSDNLGHVVTADGVNGSAVLDGVTVADGRASNLFFIRSGGGLLVASGAPTFRACLFRDNECTISGSGTEGGGGAAVRAGAAPRFEDCVFRDNFCSEGGAGMHSLGEATLLRCRFEDNATSSSGFGPGGGLQAEAGALVLVDCDFTGNFGDGDGGGLAARDASVIAIGCLFEDNTGDSGGGGADVSGGAGEALFLGCSFIDNDGSSSGFATGGGLALTRPGIVAHCLFRNNGSDRGGGISVSNDILVTHCRFLANGAGNGGGGLVQFSGHVRIVNCLFSGNATSTFSASGGGMTVRDSEIVGCTVVNNVSLPGIAGIRVDSDTATITNSILWGNGNGSEPQQLTAGNSATVIVDHTCIQGLTGAFGGTGNVGDDPMFVNAVGPDGVPGTVDDDLRLQPLSPCTDAGTNAALDGCVLDLDGASRTADDPLVPDPAPPGTAGLVDLGAYERLAPPRPDCDGDRLDDACAAGSLAPDCDGNGIPDACDIADGTAADCNVNLVPDSCDIAMGDSADCDGDGVPDECAIAAGLATDCDGNGVLDACDLAARGDCNGNGLPDACDVREDIALHFPPTGPVGYNTPVVFTLEDPAPALGDVLIRVQAVADIATSNERLTVTLEDTFLGLLYNGGFYQDCAAIPAQGVLVVPAAVFNAALPLSGDAELTVLGTFEVNPTQCGGTSSVEVDVEYVGVNLATDANADGIPDACACPADLDGSGAVDFADVLVVIGAWGPCPPETGPCPADLDQNGTVGFGDILAIVGAWGTCP